MTEQRARVFADDGFFFGIGVFETIAVEHGRAIMLEAHLERMREAARFLAFDFDEDHAVSEVERTLEELGSYGARWALKLAASPENLLVTTRPNPYGGRDYKRGFTCTLSPVRRNETSPIVFYKTFNYGDCLIEKRRAASEGFDEPLFLNSRGLLTEGATTNVFLVTNDELVTPRAECGLLPGIVRGWVLAHGGVVERDITLEDALSAEEMFLTNSLLGIMPVASLDGHAFPSRFKARELLSAYKASLQDASSG